MKFDYTLDYWTLDKKKFRSFIEWASANKAFYSVRLIKVHLPH